MEHTYKSKEIEKRIKDSLGLIPGKILTGLVWNFVGLSLWEMSSSRGAYFSAIIHKSPAVFMAMKKEEWTRLENIMASPKTTGLRDGKRVKFSINSKPT